MPSATNQSFALENRLLKRLAAHHGSLPRNACESKTDLEMILIETVKTVSGKILRAEQILSTYHIPHPNTHSAVCAVWSDTVC